MHCHFHEMICLRLVRSSELKFCDLKALDASVLSPAPREVQMSVPLRAPASRLQGLGALEPVKLLLGSGCWAGSSGAWRLCLSRCLVNV